MPSIHVQPSLIAPPARFQIDPYYTKFTYAREFIVLGSKQVRDAAYKERVDWRYQKPMSFR